MKRELHPRSRHRDRYDFAALIQVRPELARFIVKTPSGSDSIDFADPEAVKALNQAILLKEYHIRGWDVPPGSLCPPIPGRADYLHYAADLLAANHGGTVPKGRKVRVLDIGCGANCIYPLIGQAEYGWSFVGTDINSKAHQSANEVLSANDKAKDLIELRLQRDPKHIFEGVVRPGEIFDLTLCNPPFHSSPEEAREGTRRKWKNLGKGQSGAGAPTLNFGGEGPELWCEGGERAFILRMIKESGNIPRLSSWFTTLVSKDSNLPLFARALDSAGARESRVIEMAQGQKKSRLLAWTFQASKLSQ